MFSERKEPVKFQLITQLKDVMQGKLFQKCTHLLYCSVLSLGGNVNTRRMSKPDMGTIFHIKKSMKYSGHRKLLCELSKLSNSAQRNWFQYVRRVYTTAINFPCITPLTQLNSIFSFKLKTKDFMLVCRFC